MKKLGDLAEQVAVKLAADVSAPVEEATTIAEESALQAENSLFTKIRFSWKAEDRAILDRIRIAADAMFQEAFTETINTIDSFYLQLRIAETREVGGHTVVVIGADGRPVWQRDGQGQIVEDWNQITGQTVEMTLANLSRLRLTLAPQVNELFLEAVFARHGASDMYDDTWFTMMDGTQGDRQARSNRESRQDRYAAYFRFYLHSVAKTFMDEISNFEKLLNNIRYWQIRSQRA
jgi:hypothetical protein